MAGPVIYDEIFNRFFKSQVVTIDNDGYVVGDKLAPHSNQKVEFIDKGGDNFLIKVVTSGTYIVPHDIAESKYLFGYSLKEYIWRVVPKSSPIPGYYFETTDGQLTWYLPSGVDATRIELTPVKDIRGTANEEKAEWVWKKD